MGETYAEWKNEAELARLWRLQTLAEDDGSCFKRCVEFVFTKTGYKLGFWGTLGQKLNWANPI